MNNRRFAIAAAVATLLLAGCSGDGKRPPSGEDVAPAPATYLPSVPSAASPALDSLPGALLVKWEATRVPGGPVSYSRGLAWPLEAATLVEIDVQGPLDLAVRPGITASPDARLIAVWAGNQVRVHDLAAWREVARIEAPPGLVPGAWSGDGSQLVAWRDFCRVQASEGRCPGGWERELWRLDIAAGTAERLASFDFAPIRMHFGPNSEQSPVRAYSLAIRTDICCGIDPKGDPFVAVLDIAHGGVIAEIPLPGLLAGQLRQWLGRTDTYASYWPATALAPEGSSLYVVDSADFRMMVIDLEALRVDRVVDLKEPRSRLARLGDWFRSLFARTAEAKGNPGYSRQAEVTPDGKHLVISRTVSLEHPAGSTDPSWKDRPAGLVVVDLERMAVVLREETSDSFRVSPDGRWLLARGSYYDQPDSGGDMVLVAFGLKLIDLQSLNVVRHLLTDEDVHVDGFSLDGRYAYVSTNIWSDSTPGVGTCREGCKHVRVIDMASTEVLAERILGEGQGILTLR